MVKICNDSYDNDKYDEFFKKFEFNLSDFQKYAIEGIVSNNHVLVTAHTGSGKTLPAEFAIEYFCNKGKKVIYTSPIKALSNQKYYEFSKKFPNISFGILTGDIKFNPEADVLIMTTEILQNTLHKKKSKTSADVLQFDMDIENELSCVIFDEIHYINDQHRGKVWETSILLLPPHVQLVMLSATIHNSEVFAKWCEDRYDDNKEVYLASTEHRVVPLKHYYYTTVNEYLFKILKDKDKEKEIRGFVDKLHLIKNKDFNNDLYETNKKLLDLFDMKNCFIKPQFVLNKLIKYLYDEEMLPALCFVFSRKNVERFANDITVNLFGYDDAHVPSIIQKECEKIIRKLPNYEEYLNLPEYINMIKLLEKGIGIHHSGIMPVLREMVELLFGKGYIKVLFATETFAVGINMPTKTVIFSGMNKFTEDGLRNIFPHEYTQMAGRAGRRGLDSVGHVIHALNLYSNNIPSINEYKKILSGTSQVLISKFKITYHLILNMIYSGDYSFESFVEKSMMQNELMKQLKTQQDLILTNKKDLEKQKSLPYMTSKELVKKYIELQEKIETITQPKKKKPLYKELENLKFENKNIMKDLDKYRKQQDMELELYRNENYFENVKKYIKTTIDKIIDTLYSWEFISKNEEDKYELTWKGKIAANVNEVHGLMVAEFISKNKLDDLSSSDLVSIFSCFTNLNIREEFRLFTPKFENKNVNNLVIEMMQTLKDYEDYEYKNNIDVPNNDKEIIFDIMNEVVEWYNAENEDSCKKILINLQEKKEIFLGEFVKALLKINNIVQELICVCEITGNVKLNSKLNVISSKLLKYVATNQSLYV
tara:strand:- start:515 stop:2983 length:2469 start_codon:yes stop_codon:yes gene_type:complete